MKVLVQIFTLIFLIFSINIFGQEFAVDTVWTATFGGEFNEEPISIRANQDGGFILAATQWGTAPYFKNFWLIKIDSFGREIWTKIIDLGANEELKDMELLSDGSIILTGALYLPGQGRPIWIAKCDSLGNQIWSQKPFGNLKGYGIDINVLDNDDFLITGAKQDSVFLLKMSSNGELFWQHTYDNFSHISACGEALDILSTGKIIIGANIRDLHGNWEFPQAGLYFLSSEGKFEHFNIYEYYPAVPNPLVDMEITSCGNILILGRTSETTHYIDAYVKSISANKAEVLWSQTYGSWNYDYVYDMFLNEHGSFIACGYTEGFGIPDNKDYWIFKCDNDGNLIWNFSMGGESQETAYSIISINENEYVFAGSFKDQDELGTQILVVKLAEHVSVITGAPFIIPKSYQLYQNFPNPFNTSTTIQYTLSQRAHVKINIYNIHGQIIHKLVNQHKPPGHYAVFWDGKNEKGKFVGSGIYFCTLKIGENYLISQKMIMIK